MFHLSNIKIKLKGNKMKCDIDWQKKAVNLLKAEIIRKGLSYDELSEALLKIGIKKTPNNINVTLNRGTFSFVFFLQCAKAINLDLIRLNDC